MRSFVKKIIRLMLGSAAKKKDYYYDMRNNPAYAKYSIGEYTYGTPSVMTWDDNTTLEIGKFCSIAPNVTILLGGNHRVDWITTFPFNVIFDEFKAITGHPASKGDVRIGNDVWIGRDVLILSGVKIGDGAVIAAGSVVVKDVQPYTVVGGNPARFLKQRFSDEAIRQLLNIEWWNWEIETIKANVPSMLSSNIEVFLEKARTVNCLGSSN